MKVGAYGPIYTNTKMQRDQFVELISAINKHCHWYKKEAQSVLSNHPLLKALLETMSMVASDREALLKALLDDGAFSNSMLVNISDRDIARGVKKLKGIGKSFIVQWNVCDIQDYQQHHGHPSTFSHAQSFTSAYQPAYSVKVLPKPSDTSYFMNVVEALPFLHRYHMMLRNVRPVFGDIVCAFDATLMQKMNETYARVPVLLQADRPTLAMRQIPFVIAQELMLHVELQNKT